MMKLKKILSRLFNKVDILPKKLIIPTLIALLSFPLWYYWIYAQSVPVEVQLAAPGIDIVKAYWGNPQTHQEHYVPILVKPAEKQNWKIKIEALGEKNFQSNGYEVAILDIRTPERQVDWSKSKLQGNWEIRDSPGAPQDKALIAHSYASELRPGKMQSLEVPIEGGDLEIKLLGHGGAGKARITVGEREKEVDLYRPKSFEAIVKFSPFGPGDSQSRAYQIDAHIPLWSKLQFLANEGTVKVKEVKVKGKIILPNANNEYILPKPYFILTILTVILEAIIIFILIQTKTGFGLLQIASRNISSQRSIRAFFLTLPAAIAALVAQREVSLHEILFEGGTKVLLFNICIGVIFVYMVTFMLALGTLFFPSPPKAIEKFLAKADLEILRFFSGAAILILVGFVLGCAKLLISLITIPLFLTVNYIYFLHYPNLFKKLWHWLLFKEEKVERKYFFKRKVISYPKTLKIISIYLHFLFAFFVLYLVLEEGIFVDLMSSDLQPAYIAYIAEVRRFHGIWLNHRELPLIGDFLVGRGNGIHLFFASFTNQYFVQSIGVMYFIAIAIFAYRFVVKFCDWCQNSTAYLFMRGIFPISAAFLMITSSLPTYSDLGKYHIQTGAFFICISFYGAHFLFLKRKYRQWLLVMMLPMTIALGLAIPGITPVLFLIFSGLTLISYLARRKISFIFPFFFLMVANLPALFVSLLINHVYIGIPELHPWYLLINFANLERFQQWASIEQWVFIGLTHEIFPFHWSILYIFNQFFLKPDRVLVTAFCFVLIVTLLYTLSMVFEKILKIIILRKQYRDRYKNSSALNFKLRIAFLFNLFWLYPIGIFFISFTSQGSIIRLFSILIFYKIVALFGMMIFLFYLHTIKKVFTLKKYKNPKIILFFNREIITIPIFLSILIGLYYIMPFGKVIFSSSYRYFLGKEAMIDGIPFTRGNYLRPFSKTDFYRPLEIKNLLPIGAKILPLNAILETVPALHSPLLPRGMFVHHYESDLSRYFGEIVLDSPATSYKRLRAVNIDFFYFEKNNIRFFSSGYSEAFGLYNLMNNFDIYYETKDYIIFTWRGDGIKPVDLETSSHVEEMREMARTTNPFYRQCWNAILKLKVEYRIKKISQIQK